MLKFLIPNVELAPTFAHGTSVCGANYNRVNLATIALKANKAGLSGIFETSLDAIFFTKLDLN